MFSFINRSASVVAREEPSSPDEFDFQRMPRSQSTGSVSSTMSEQQRIQDLEDQLKDLSYTCATALDRVSELESQLAMLESSPQFAEGPNSNVLPGTPSDRLKQLESAVRIIRQGRSELRNPTYYSYA